MADEGKWRAVLFDWSGTLARRKMRDVLLSGSDTCLYDNTPQLLRKLAEQKLSVGVVSNTSQDAVQLRAMVDRVLPGLVHVQVYDNDDPSLKQKVRKPNPDMFWMAAQQLRIPPAHYDRVLVVGDKTNDHFGALRAGMASLADLVNQDNMDDPVARLIVDHLTHLPHEIRQFMDTPTAQSFTVTPTDLEALAGHCEAAATTATNED